MATFQYEAMDNTGLEVKDTIEATSEQEAQSKIREKGFFVTKIAEKGRGKKTKEGGKTTVTAMDLLSSVKRLVSAKSTMIGVTEAVCPYCAHKLEKMPGRKKKCPACGKPIFVRTRPQDKARILVRDEQLVDVEEQCAIANGTHEKFLARREKLMKPKQPGWWKNLDWEVLSLGAILGVPAIVGLGLIIWSGYSSSSNNKPDDVAMKHVGRERLKSALKDPNSLEIVSEKIENGEYKAVYRAKNGFGGYNGNENFSTK